MVYTPLHCHLLERRYKDARDDLRSNQRDVMVRQRHSKNLPLHLALLIGAPDELVIDLYQAFPEAARLPASTGKTAIEIAKEKCRSGAVLSVICTDCIPINAPTRRSIDPSLRESATPESESLRSLLKKSLSMGDLYRGSSRSSSSSFTSAPMSVDSISQHSNSYSNPHDRVPDVSPVGPNLRQSAALKSNTLRPMIQKSLSRGDSIKSSKRSFTFASVPASVETSLNATESSKTDDLKLLLRKSLSKAHLYKRSSSNLDSFSN